MLRGRPNLSVPQAQLPDRTIQPSQVVLGFRWGVGKPGDLTAPGRSQKGLLPIHKEAHLLLSCPRSGLPISTWPLEDRGAGMASVPT